MKAFAFVCTVFCTMVIVASAVQIAVKLGVGFLFGLVSACVGYAFSISVLSHLAATGKKK
jgi:hypothetical protein